MKKEISRTVYTKQEDGKWQMMFKQTDISNVYYMLSHLMLCKYVRKTQGYRMTSKNNLDGTYTITFTFGSYKCVFIVDD